MRRDDANVASFSQLFDEKIGIRIDRELGRNLQILAQSLGKGQGLQGPLSGLSKYRLESPARLVNLMPENERKCKNISPRKAHNS